MRFYAKAVRAYFRIVFLPDEDEKHGWENSGLPGYNSNFVKRYFNYTMDGLMIVNPKTGCYEHYDMPRPFCWPGKIGWQLLHIWQTKIVKTHV